MKHVLEKPYIVICNSLLIILAYILFLIVIYSLLRRIKKMYKNYILSLFYFLLTCCNAWLFPALATDQRISIDTMVDDVSSSELIKAPLSVRASPPVVYLSLLDDGEAKNDFPSQILTERPVTNPFKENNLEGEVVEAMLSLAFNANSPALEEIDEEFEREIEAIHEKAVKWLQVKKMTLALILNLRARSDDYTLSLKKIVKIKRGIFQELRDVGYLSDPLPDEGVFSLLHLSEIDSLMRLMNQAHTNFGARLNEIEGRVKSYVYREKRYFYRCVEKADLHYKAVIG
jgi:hypothetical protein